MTRDKKKLVSMLEDIIQELGRQSKIKKLEAQPLKTYQWEICVHLNTKHQNQTKDVGEDSTIQL